MPQHEMTTAALEAYVLAETDAERAAIVANLPQGSEARYELDLAERFRSGKIMDNETEELITSFEKSFKKAAEQWKLRWLVLRAGNFEEGSEEQKKAIKDLMPELGIRFTHTSHSAAVAGPASGSAQGDARSVLSATPEVNAVGLLQAGNRDVMQRLPARLLADVDFTKLAKDEDFLHFIRVRQQQVPGLATNKTFMARILVLLRRSTEALGAFQELDPVLSLEQLECLAEELPRFREEPSFVQAIMLRRFPDAFRPVAAHLLTLEERRMKLMELAEFVLGWKSSGSGHTLKLLLSRILLQILQLHVQMNKPDKKTLLLYLEEAQKTAASNLDRPVIPNRFDRMHLPLICSSMHALALQKPVIDQPPVREHLRAFAREDDFWMVVSPLLLVNEHVLRRFRAEVMLLAGQQPMFPEAVDADWLQELSERSCVMLLPHNKESFEADEAVKLSVRLKNVSQLVVRIYEINAESYYMHHHKEFTSDVCLDGIGATLEVEHAFNHAAIVEHDEELTFEQLAGKQGIFVLDFIGADLRARAVVPKGRLSLIHRPTPVGHIAYVLAPDRSIVQSGARLCLEGRWYESDSENGGRVILPFGKRKQKLKIVIAALGMAQVTEFEHFKEQYEMIAGFVLVNESVVLGQNAKLLIQPKLTCCGRSCDLKLLKKAQVVISMRCGFESVPTVRTFADVSWETGNMQVAFSVPPKLKSIEATLEVEVFNHSNQEVEKLSSTRRWRIDDLSRDISCFDIFLSRPTAGFEVRCLGKDGEPRIGTTVAVTMHGSVASHASLVTDGKGSVHLGPLDGVQRLEATAAGVVRCWALPPMQKVVYPAELDMLEGDAMVLPVLESDVACVQLVELVGDKEQTLSLKTSPEQITAEASRSSIGLGSVSLKALQRGSYRLLVGDQITHIKVHRGQKWHNDYVLRQDAIVEHPDRQRVLAVKSARVGPDGVAVELQGYSPNTMVHVFGLRFLPSDVLDVVKQLLKAAEEPLSAAEFPFQGSKNVFVSNCNLGDELGYVLRRRKASAQVGNMLKRPNLLMQPHAVQETSFLTEILTKSAAPHAEACGEPESLRSMGAGVKMRKAMGFRPLPKSCEGAAAQDSCIVEEDVVQGVQNFLKEEPVVLWNQRPDEEGKVGVQTNFSHCNSVLVVVVDAGSVTHRLIPVGDNSAGIVSRGLTLQEPLAQDRFFLEKRTATALKAGAAIDINDQASVEWRAIDSVERLLAFYKAVCPQHLETVSAWSLEAWDRLDREAKAQIWSVHACHEFHLFVYMKDPKFFKEAVIPFLQSKMEKSVIDWFLLGDVGKLKPYLAPALFQAMNPLEKVLILRAMASDAELKSHCQKLALAVTALAKKNRCATRRNALLDSVLSLEAMKEREGMDEQMETDDAYSPDDDFEEESVSRDREKEKEESKKEEGRRDRARSRSREARRDDFKLFECSEDARGSVEQKRRRMGAWEEVEGTKECLETQYLVRSSMEGRAKPSSADFTLSEFWSDAANHALEASSEEVLFLSPNFIFATSSPHEVLTAIALVDVPLAAERHTLVSHAGLSASFEAASPCLFVAKEIVAVAAPDGESDVRVAVRVYKATLDETTSTDPRAVAEFVAGEAYCLQAVITNVSPKEVEAQVLTQIPEGSMPLAASSYTTAQTTRLSAFACWRTKVCFYFPRAGRYTGAPVYCSVNGKAAAASDIVVYNVVTKASIPEVQSFSDILAAGEDAVIKFLQDADILGGDKGFAFRQLHMLLRSPTFFAKALETLRGRCVFDRSVWEYGFLHGDVSACKEMLAIASDFQQRLGPFFESPLVSAVDAALPHLEYHPLVNKRAHRLSESAPKILNEQLRKTYEKTILALARKCRPLDVSDELRLSYYLLCQDRVQEAQLLYSRAAAKQRLLPASGELLWQMEYMTAYLDLFDAASDHSDVQRIVKSQRSCPHAQWRRRFGELASALAEGDGGEAAMAGVISEPAPALSASLHRSTLEIEASGLAEITVRLYSAELEVLFSRMPFIKAESLNSEFSFVKPILEVSIPGDAGSWQLPEEFRNMDLAVELAANNALHVFQMHYAAGLRVAVAEQQGYLTVTNPDGKALPATYVKVFARAGGAERFFKDGYTDLRGRFDYASLSGESAGKVDRFAMLVTSTKLGGVVREAPPPKRSGP